MQAVLSQTGNRVLPAQKQRASRAALSTPHSFIRTHLNSRRVDRFSTRVMVSGSA